jgi:nucleotidyltransferase substrate binding protein (TIGR01987 family)
VERLSERLAEAEAALVTLDELVRQTRRSIVERDAALMRFTYTFEVVWKTAQRYLFEHEGLDVGSPKQAIRASRRIGLLTDEQAEAALRMADDRNLVVHVYREAVARDLDSRLSGHAVTLAAWVATMRAPG